MRYKLLGRSGLRVSSVLADLSSFATVLDVSRSR
jgi:hypothetical protein